MLTVILLALAGAVISAVVGTVWYSSTTPMGKAHMSYLGFDKLSPEEQKAKIEEAKPRMWKMYAAQVGLSALTSFAAAFIVTMGMRNGLPFSMALFFIAMNWLCFMVPIIGTSLLWSNCERKLAWKKFASDSAYQIVVLAIIAYLAYFFV